MSSPPASSNGQLDAQIAQLNQCKPLPELEEKRNARMWLPSLRLGKQRPSLAVLMYFNKGYASLVLRTVFGESQARCLPMNSSEGYSRLFTDILGRQSRLQTRPMHTNTPSDLLRHLQQRGPQIDSYEYVRLLQTCVKSKDLLTGKQLHSHILHSGVPVNVYVANTLLKLYTHCGDIPAAQKLFESFPNKSVVSWNVMISGLAHEGSCHLAFALFEKMQEQGWKPDKFTYVSVLTACNSPRDLSFGREVHKHTIKAGVVSDVKVGNALISMYAKCGTIEEARKVFDEMVQRDVVSWTSLTGAYAESGHGEESIAVYQEMVEKKVQPSKITYMNVLIACGNLRALEQGKEIHAQITNSGHGSDLRVGTALTKMYFKCGAVGCARRVFEGMQRRDVVAWNTVIGGLGENAQWDEAYGAFTQMLQEGIMPNRVTYLSICSACARPGGLIRGREIHARVTKAGFERDPRIGNALMSMYCKAGSVQDAQEVFDKMLRRDVVSWTTLIGGYQGAESLNLFQQMLRAGVVPNKVTYLCVLKACGSSIALEFGKEIHSLVAKAGLDSDLQVANAVVNMYFKCGSVEDACAVFEGMVTRSTVSWSGLIGGLAQNGRGVEALEKFEEMKAANVKPDAATFVSVLSACRHAGLVEDGRRHLASMWQEYGIVATEKHYSCMVDILGRAGRLSEAQDVISSLKKMQPTASMWGALLAACRSYGNVEIAERAAEEYLTLEPENAGVYVSLSDLYAAAGRWEDAAKVRKLMQVKGLQKEPGRSWIEVEGKLHSFVANDQSHPRASEIYAEMERLMKEMKSLGYVPDTRFVMHEVGDEEKERAVCHHSEKLAIAFGILSSPPGAPIRISKNLRVCVDCHTATKFISKIVGREIVARDSHRFHHFRNGVCSCGDYW